MALERYRHWPGPTRSCLAILAILACVIFASGCSPSRSLESLSLLKAMAGGERAEDIQRLAVSFPGQGGTRQADLYRKPGAEAQAAIMILPGASPNGRDDPRVVDFASQWAEADFLVMVPEIENLRRLQVSAADAGVMADALRYLAHLAGTDRPVGAFGLSYAVGSADGGAAAAGSGRSGGLPGRARRATTAARRWPPSSPPAPIASGRATAGGGASPDAFGPWVFAHSNAGRLSDPGDEWRLRRIAERRLDDEASDIGDLTAGLGPEGLAVLAFLENSDPDAVPQLSAALPEAIKAEMQALDLSPLRPLGPRAAAALDPRQGRPRDPLYRDLGAGPCGSTAPTATAGRRSSCSTPSNTPSLGAPRWATSS